MAFDLVKSADRPVSKIFEVAMDESAAQDIADRLADIGLVSFALLSGGKGVHVVVPLTPGHTWDVHKHFARRFWGSPPKRARVFNPTAVS